MEQQQPFSKSMRVAGSLLLFGVVIAIFCGCLALGAYWVDLALDNIKEH